MSEIKPGQTYRHYKGGMYRVLCLAVYTSTCEELVIYRSMRDASVWARPVHSWLETINGVPRFELEMDV